MKKVILVVAVLICSMSANYAQKSAVARASTSLETQNFKDAKEAIDAAVVNEATKEYSKAWFIQGRVYQSINRDILGNRHLDLDANPLPKAYEGYMNAIKFGEAEMKAKADEKGKEVKPYRDKDAALGFLKEVAQEYKYKGIEEYQAANLESAFDWISKGLEIDKMEGIKVVDTLYTYYAGYLAESIDKVELAKKYYAEAIALQYGHQTPALDDEGQPQKDDTGKLVLTNEPAKQLYLTYGTLLMTSGDTAKAVSVFEAGVKKYSDATNILIQLINHYLITNQTEKAESYLDKALQQEPTNATYLFARGTIYDQKWTDTTLVKEERMKNADLALQMYERSIASDEKYLAPYFNAGILFFAKGSLIVTEASSLPASQQKEYDAKVELAKAEYKKAIPYFKSVLEIDEEEKGALNNLYIIYEQLGMEAESKEIQKKLGIE